MALQYSPQKNAAKAAARIAGIVMGMPTQWIPAKAGITASYRHFDFTAKRCFFNAISVLHPAIAVRGGNVNS
ncbi:MAG: hypothetical protein ABIU63_12965 [Chitinophagaceae bacterium]